MKLFLANAETVRYKEFKFGGFESHEKRYSSRLPYDQDYYD
jgi:hypothetical protein